LAKFCSRVGFIYTLLSTKIFGYLKMLTLSDTLRDAPLSQTIEKFSTAPPPPPENCFEDYTVVDGWFIKKKALGGYDSFRATDVVWVYP
jgi:hypothetical protein